MYECHLVANFKLILFLFVVHIPLIYKKIKIKTVTGI